MPIEILMPALSPTMTEGNLANWLKKEGDNVAPGDVIAEIETDKATMEVEAVDEGVIGKILVGEGTQAVQVNQVIALLLADGEDKSALDGYTPKAAPAPKAEEKTAPKPTPAPKKVAPKKVAPKKVAPKAAPRPAPKAAPVKAPVVTNNDESDQQKVRIKISPIAKRLADSYGIDPVLVRPTGPSGRIVKADIEGAIAKGVGGSRVRRQLVEQTAVPNDNMRKVIASRLLESKQTVPHFYLSVDCQLDKLLDVRKDLNDAAPKGADGKPAYKLSVNDLIIKAVALGMAKVPDANASWTDDAILLNTNVDVSVAVAIDGGLITPIVHNADQKDLPSISNEMKGLIAKAKAGTLQPEEFQGGGFSISNLGMFGIKQFQAIVNPPQGCILAVGAGEKRPVVNGDSIDVATVMTVTLSCDHRVVDGAVGAQFLQAFKNVIEKPVLLVA